MHTPVRCALAAARAPRRMKARMNGAKPEVEAKRAGGGSPAQEVRACGQPIDVKDLSYLLTLSSYLEVVGLEYFSTPYYF